MQQQPSVKTTCPYCGVGCGIVVSSKDSYDSVAVNKPFLANEKWILKGDKEHPANLGRLCSKGSNLLDTVGLEGRVLYPQFMGKQVSWETALSNVSEKIQATIKEHGPESFAMYASAQLLTED